MTYAICITVLTAYLLGNVNGAVVISRMVVGEDVRKHGSGNAGLTNFIRNYGISNALLVILIDAGKAALACLLGGLLLNPYGYDLEGAALGGLCVMVGHDFPALLKFKGGKGILSGLFVALVVDWRIAVLILIVFFAAYLLTWYVSLGSVLASIAFGVGFVIFHHDNWYVMGCGVLMSLLAVFMHRSNIVRLIRGEESKTNLFGKGSKK